MEAIPDIVDNHKHNLAQVLQTILRNSKNPTMDVVTAFFNLRALEVLEPAIGTVTRFRLLLGKEQKQTFLIGKNFIQELQKATSKAEITTSKIKRWKDFFAQDNVEVRHYDKNFCHGKAYIITGVTAIGELGIVGSSNFTGAGLTTNVELNAVLKQTSAVQELRRWFENLWINAEDYKTELLALLEHFTRTYTPYEIYMKIVYEALRDKLEQRLSEKDRQPSPSIALTDFQHDGYKVAKEILENYGGVLIADSVGLGKTYLTLKLLDDYAYRERQTALIICPAAVIDTVWRPRLQEHAIPHKIISMETLSRKDFPIKHARSFQIVVVDESHNFRNPQTNRWINLFQIIKSKPDKKVILLTATPVNNTTFDLYHQLRLITRDNPRALVSAGIADLKDYFRKAEQNQEALYEVLEALAVRRSRQFIRQNYPNAAIDGHPIRFPNRKLHTVNYSLKKTYGQDLYNRIATTIENLRLAPYQIETYRREITQKSLTLEQLQQTTGWSQRQANEFFMAVGRQTALANIMRVLYLKRLESSVEALKISLQRLQNFLEKFLKALEKGKLLRSHDFYQWLRMETSDEEGSEDLDTWFEALEEADAAHYDIESLRKAVLEDLKALREVVADLEKTHHDDKMETLKRLLTSSKLRGKKIVIFSYFRDTARYIYNEFQRDEKFLKKLGHRRIAIIDSHVKPSERSDLVSRFAPQANGRQNLPKEQQTDLLVSTDALSEGQNLQDGEIIINYDLHWNPVRMVQRIGRLDRLGSPHPTIHIYNFFPEQELEDLLGLITRLHQKLEDINRAVGLDASVLGESPNPMDFNILRRIQEGKDLETLQDLEAKNELTIGEFLKQDLLQFLRRLGEEHLERIPMGVGTAKRRKESPGFFAAFRNPVTGYHHWLFLDDRGKVITGSLRAIAQIRCDASEQTIPLPSDFDPSPYITKLRKYLYNQIRATEYTPLKLPPTQRQIVNWLRTLPPSDRRNDLLQYFETQTLGGPTIKELGRIWKKRITLPESKWMEILLQFVQKYPRDESPPSPPSLSPEREEDLECIAWVRLM